MRTSQRPYEVLARIRCFMKTASEKKSRKPLPLTPDPPRLEFFDTPSARAIPQTDRQTDRRSHTTVLYARINERARVRITHVQTFSRIQRRKTDRLLKVQSSFEKTDRSIEKKRRETTFRPHPKKTNRHQYSQS